MKMQNFLLMAILSLLIIILSGCGPLPSYKVEISLIYPIYSEHLFFQDDLMAITFVFKEKAIYYEILNMTGNTLEIYWYDAKFILPSGENVSIYCFPKDKLNFYYMDKAYWFTISLVPPYGNISAYMVPKNMVKRDKSLYDNSTYYFIDGKLYSQYQEGAINIGLKIPVKNKDKRFTRTYDFVFNIKVTKIYD